MQQKRKTKNNFFISILINFIVDNYHEKADIKESHRDMANTEKSKKSQNLCDKIVGAGFKPAHN